MAGTQFPDDLIDLQRRAYAAWDAVESHRKSVDTRRRAQALPPPGNEPWRTPALPPWTQEEDERHAELMAAARQAQEALAEGIARAGLAPTFEVTRDLRKAAREA